MKRYSLSIIRTAVTASAVAVAFGGAAAAFAADATVGASASMSASASTSPKSAKMLKAQVAMIPKIISRADQEITRRIDSLTKLNTNITAMKHVTDAVKANVSGQVQGEITALTTLKTKIDAETDITALRADVKTITDSYRVYALVLPQLHILVAADRISSILADATAISTKLQTRIAAAQTAGKDVTTIQASLVDMNSSLTDASTQAAAAVTAINGLVPDGGDKTKADANHAALVLAQSKIKAGTADIKKSNSDAHAIVKALQAFHLKASMSATTSAAASTTGSTGSTTNQ